MSCLNDFLFRNFFSFSDVNGFMFERNVDANPFKMESVDLTLIWVGFLGVRFEVGERGQNYTLYLKLVRIMLEP